MIKRTVKRSVKFVWDSLILCAVLYGVGLIIKLPLDMWRDHFSDKRFKKSLTEDHTVV